MVANGEFTFINIHVYIVICTTPSSRWTFSNEYIPVHNTKRSLEKTIIEKRGAWRAHCRVEESDARVRRRHQDPG